MLLLQFFWLLLLEVSCSICLEVFLCFAAGPCLSIQTEGSLKCCIKKTYSKAG